MDGFDHTDHLCDVCGIDRERYAVENSVIYHFVKSYNCRIEGGTGEIAAFFVGDEIF